MLFPENFFHFREKYHISEKFFGISGNIFSYLGKNVIYSENYFGMSGKFFEMTSSPPVANISWKKFLDALFFRKVPLKAWPSPTFRSFLRPWAKELLKEGSKGADVNEGKFVLNIDVSLRIF